MASTALRLREFVAEYNRFAFTDEKRLLAAETDGNEAIAALAGLQAAFNDSNRSFDDALKLADEVAQQKARLASAREQAHSAKADLDCLAGRYADLAAELEASDDQALAEPKQWLASIKAEHAALCSRADQAIAALGKG